MKICFIALEVVPNCTGVYIGGIPNNVIRLVEALSQRGHYVRVLTSDVYGYLRRRVKSSWGKTYPIKVHGEYSSILHGMEFFVRSFVKTLTDQKFDIYHIHSAFPILSTFSFFLSLIPYSATVFTLYSPIGLPTQKFCKGIPRFLSHQGFSKFFLSRVASLIAVSENTWRSVLPLGLDKRIIVIPPCIDTLRFNPLVCGARMRKLLKIAGDTSVLLYCGNWAEWKGIDTLLTSLPKILKQYPDTKLITAWGEQYRWYDNRKIGIEKKIDALGLRENIIQLGVLRNIEELMAACDIFVAPFRDMSRIADCPLSILEAMACGKPVVATSLGGVPEIVEHKRRGLLVQPNNDSELADAIGWLIQNKVVAERMGKEGSDYVLKNYAADQIAGYLENTYQGLLTERVKLH